MIKRVIVLMLCLLLTVSMVAYADNEPPVNIEAPRSFNVLESDHPGTLYLRFAEPDSVAKALENDEYWLYYEFDWKINNNPWKFNKSWGSFTTEGLWDYYGDDHHVFGYVNNVAHDEDNAITIFVNHTELGIDYFDLQNNTFYFRIRYIYEYDHEDGYKHVVSPYTEASIGKFGTSILPTSLETPKNLAGELRRQADGKPYFHFTWDVPNSVLAANQLTEVVSWIDWKIGSGKWASESGVLLMQNNMLGYSMDADPVEKNAWGDINIEENIYQFRKFFEFEKPDGTRVRSPFSNIVTIGTPAFSGASSWAVGDLNKAAAYGFVTERIKGNLGGPITREEFAEMAVIFYEKFGKKATYTDMSVFTDTNNPEIFKAYEANILSGVGNSKFAPNNLIKRQEIAAMATRAVKSVRADADFSTSGVTKFPDQNLISDWALEVVKFSNKNGLIGGLPDGRINPLGTTTREQAVLIIFRAYKKYKL